MPSAASRNLELVAPYVPRLLLQWLEADRDLTTRALVGTMVLVDISGFTKLSERLARRGREGAEELSEAIGSSFAAILALAYANGGGLLKFGGDALLLWFHGDDHVARACRSAVWMRRTLRDVGRLRTTGGQVTLRMSVGIHTGSFHFFLVGDDHRELLVTGPAASRTVEMEHEATAGQILVSPDTAASLAPSVLGRPVGPGVLLARAPGGAVGQPPEPRETSDAEAVLGCIPVTLRDRVLADVATPEHRNVTVAFLRFRGTDALLSRGDLPSTAARIHETLAIVQRASSAHQVTVLGSDVDTDGGKVILSAGAPTTRGDDEERMLLTIRQILDAEAPLPIQIGAHRGNVFAGDIGPDYRRTYTVMGDTVNLAARLMARAEPGTAIITPAVTDRSRTRFHLTALPPFTVKGKAEPIEAAELGTPRRGGDGRRRERPPMVGREREMTVLRAALDDARRRRGRLVEIVGEPGIGKSRLLEEVTTEAGDFVSLPTVCETFATSTAYHPLRSLLRGLLGVEDGASDREVLERLGSIVTTNAAPLSPWLPLLATVVDVACDDTAETAALDERFRRDRLHEILDGFLDAVLPTATLLVFEDTHLMDEASAAFLTHLAGTLDGRPWVVIGTRRDLGTGFVAPNDATVLRPAPLDAKAAARLIEGDAGGARIPLHVMDRLAERSGGNPLFLRELVAAVSIAGRDDELPDSVEALIAARIDQLPPEDRDLLRRAAVLGERFPLEHLEALVGDALQDLPRRLDGFLALDDGHAVFSHALVQETAYGSLPFRLRRELHGAVADTIARGVDDPRDVADVLSLHATAAHRWRQAWRMSVAAAERARSRSARADEAVTLERALMIARHIEVSPRQLVAVYEALGEARNILGSFEAAGTAFSDAARLEPDPVRKAELVLRRAYMSYYRTRYGSALSLIRRARRLVEGEDRRGLGVRASLSVAEAIVRYDQGRSSDAERIARIAIQEARTARVRETYAHALYILDLVLWSLGRGAEAVHSSEALRIYQDIDDEDGEATVLNNLGMFAYFEGRWDDAVELYTRCRDIALRRGDVQKAAIGMLNIAEVLSDQGHLYRADEQLEEVLRIWRAADLTGSVVDALLYRGRVLMRMGRFTDGEAAMQEARALAEGSGAEAQRAFADLLLAECAALQGNAESALRTLEGAREIMEIDGGYYVPLALRVQGWALAVAGRRDEAIDAFTRSLAAARQGGADYEAAVTIRALLATLGAEATLEGDVEAADLTLARLKVERVAETPIGAPATADRPRPPR